MNMDLQGLIEYVQKQRGGITVLADSRYIKQGDIFVAIKGTKADGHDFIDKALAAGAGYIVAEKPVNCPAQQLVIVDDTTMALGLLAQAARGNPAAKTTNLAVTGTNGKTTVTFLTRSVIITAGNTCGLVGTVINDTGLAQSASAMTTPDAVEMARICKQMVDADVKYLVLEASSHALDQNRLCGIEFKAAAFTNLTPEHLDYHQDMDKYLAAKIKLFRQLRPDAAAILNADDPASGKIAANTIAKVYYYSVNQKADITARIINADMFGTRFELCFAGKSAIVESPLIGRHNISNHLAAAGLCIGAGFSLEQIAKGLGRLKLVPGRLERVACGQDFTVLVDYAHTDDALKNVLSTLRPLCKGRLITVFGCGGDRDKTKRPRMARVAADLADKIFITSDNPRTENPYSIINDILKGLNEKDMRKVKVEPDRRLAICLAIKSAKNNDVVLIAGKGHEDYQIVGTAKCHFSDREVAQEVLK